MSDLELLRRYEPVLRFTQGEMFFPMAVEPYLRQCSLWLYRPDREAQQLAGPGEVTIDRLASSQRAGLDGRLSLRFVAEPLHGLAYQRWRGTRPAFHSAGRFARVGLGPRFLDAMVSLSLLMRGTVPGGTAAAAQVQYEATRQQEPGSYPYYGRVVRGGDYVVLQYAFFYAMNDWRSSFAGVNDHEADWEQVFVFLGRSGGELEPLWFAAAAHDYEGDDLRWDWGDPRLTLIDGLHPVVYVGAGSHAAYTRPGEYVTSVEADLLRPIRRGAEALRAFWRDTLRQGEAEGFVRGVEGLVRVPFVDYARGDGLAIGAGEETDWCPVLIGERVPWVAGFHGLWGLDTQDYFSGESAPAGPMYTRSGAVRRSWYDPVGWVGLTKVAPPDQAPTVREALDARLTNEMDEQEQRAATLREELPRLGMEVAALRGRPRLRDLHAARAAELGRREAEFAEVTARLEELRRAGTSWRESLEGSAMTDPAAPESLRRLEPEPPESGHKGRVAELWAAASSGVVLLGAVAVVTLGGSPLFAVGLLAVAAVAVDAILRGYVVRLLLNITIGLALITLAILVFEFFWQISLLAITAIGLTILFGNLRELHGR